MPVERRKADFSSAKCKTFINGTLHVVGTFTTNNLFHAGMCALCCFVVQYREQLFSDYDSPFSLTVNDNLLPLLSQLLLDGYLHPEYLQLARSQLVDFQSGSDPDSVPHMALLKEIIPYAVQYSPYASRGSAAGRLPAGTGLCVKRVVWGSGARLIYNHLLVRLRRESVQLLRELMIHVYKPPVPLPFLQQINNTCNKGHKYTDSNSNSTQSAYKTMLYPTTSSLIGSDLPPTAGSAITTHSVESVCKPLSAYDKYNLPFSSLLIKQCARTVSRGADTTKTIATATAATTISIKFQTSQTLYRPLNIAFFTRGDSSSGRSIKNEEAIVSALLARGAHATLCCNFKTMTLKEQLGFGVYADVVMG